MSQPRVVQIPSGKFDLPQDDRGLSLLVSAPARDINASGPWEVGQTVDGLYEVKKILGHGGMGIVYLVHHVNWNVDLAVKCVLESQKADPEIVRAFLHEADKWIHLGLHPNVVSCYYVRKYGDAHYIFLEYVPGVSLRKLLDSGIELTFQQKLDIAIQVCWGLSHCHKKGMIHRDIKPENILLCKSEEVDLYDAKLTDFGLVHHQAMQSAGQSQPATAEDQVLAGWGTPAYMAPELFDHPEAVSSSSDVYALGITLYELFAGRHPFGRHDFQGWRMTHHAVQPDPLRLPNGSRVCEVIAGALRKVPEDRPFLHEMAEKLFAAREGTYLRPEPREIDFQADGLNNRALSLLALGRPEEAERLWKEALQCDAHHVQATYNRGLVLWRSAKLTDETLVNQLEEARSTVRDSWQAAYLLALVHIERGDNDSAMRLLGEVAGEVDNVPAVATAVKVVCLSRPVPGSCLRTFEGHTNAVTSVAFSPDGAFCISGSRDRTLRLWEVASGKSLRTFEGHGESVCSIAFSPDGQSCLSASHDKTLRLWDVASGQCLRAFAGREGEISSVAFAPDGRLCLSGSFDKTLRLWDVASGRCLRTFAGHAAYVSSVAFSPNGQLCLSGSPDKTLRLWDVASGQCLRTFRHTDSVESAAFSPDGRFCLSGSFDKTLRLWDVASGQCLRTFAGHTASVSSVAFSPDGRFCLSGSSDKTLRFWDVASGRCLRTFKGHAWSVSSVAFSPNGRSCVSGEGCEVVTWIAAGSLRVWEVPRSRPQAPAFCRPEALGVLSERAQVAGCLETEAEALLEGGRGVEAYKRVVQAMAVPGYERRRELCVLRAKAGCWGTRSSLAFGWDVRTIEAHTKPAISVAVSPDGQCCLSGSEDGSLRLSEVASGKCLRTFEGLGDPVRSIAFSPDGQSCLSGSYDNTARLWEVASGKCLRIFQGRTGAIFVSSVAVSLDGRLCLSGSPDGTLQSWDAASGRCLRTFKGHRDSVESVAFSPDGRFCLSGSLDKTLRLWDVASGQHLRTFAERMGSISSVAFSPDGRFGLSGSFDKTLRLWDVTSGRCLRTFAGHTDRVSSVAFSPDGRLCISGGEDGALRLWELIWEYEFPELADWDHGARPHLENFLTLHTPYLSMVPEHPEFLVRRGRPTWNQEDWEGLLKTLQYAGYGWLRPEGVKREMEKMAANWNGPPPLIQ